LNDKEEKETTISIKEEKGKRKEEKKNYNCTFQNKKGPIDRLVALCLPGFQKVQ
jgi:hypothetical protein